MRQPLDGYPNNHSFCLQQFGDDTGLCIFVYCATTQVCNNCVYFFFFPPRPPQSSFSYSPIPSTYAPCTSSFVSTLDRGNRSFFFPFSMVLFFYTKLKTGLVPEICCGRKQMMPICPTHRCSCKIRAISLDSFVSSLYSMCTWAVVLLSLCNNENDTFRYSYFFFWITYTSQHRCCLKWLRTPHVEELGV